ncbi:MAG: protein kinase [Planctomycetes bacterium]|nr:protein kinase [Planctomycetota bacterium]
MSHEIRLERAMQLWLQHARSPECSDAELLKSHPDLSDLLAPLLEAPTGPEHVEHGAASGEGLVFGDFAVLRELGRGGMGVVYEALQMSLGRVVALKTIAPGATLSAGSVARMQREARTLARLDHRAIVKVVAVLEGPTPGYAMERIDGAPIDATPRSLREVVELIAQVADALEHAHAAGVVHRDVKPANILVRGNDNPVLTDFGLAQDADLPSLTRTGAFAGTPYYMSPEQASGQGIDRRSDVFSLGVTLYELVAGRRPFLGESVQDVLRAIELGDPPDPRQLRPGLPRDLAAVALKAIAHHPSNRYSSAAEFAAELRAWLGGRPVAARVPSAAARAVRWCRRHPASAAIATVVVACLAVVATLIVNHDHDLRLALETTREAEQAESRAKQDALARLWRSHIERASALSSSGRIGQRFGALGAVVAARDLLPDRNGEQTAELRRAAIACLTRPDIRCLRRWQVDTARVSVPADIGPGAALLAHPAGDRHPDAVVVVSVRDGRPITTLRGTGGIARIRFASSSRLVVLRDQELRLTELPSRAEASPRDLLAVRDVHSFAIASNRLVARLNDGSCLMYSTDGVRVAELPRPRVPPGERSWTDNAVLAPDCRNAGFATPDGNLEMVELATGKVRYLESSAYAATAFTPDGRAFAFGPTNNGIEMFDTTSGERLRTFDHHGGGMSLSIHDGGELLVSHTWWDAGLAVFRIPTGEKLLRAWWPGRVLAIRSAAECRMLLLHQDAQTLALWELDPGLVYRTLGLGRTGQGHYVDCASSPDGQLLAVSSENGLELFDGARGRRLGFVPRSGGVLQFAGTDSLLVLGEAGLQSWPLATQGLITRMGPPTRIPLPEHRMSSRIARSAQGLLAIPRFDGAWVIRPGARDGPAVSLGPHDDVRYSAVSPDGRLVATGSWTAGAKVWNARTGALVAELATGAMSQVEFSPDGRWLATTGDRVRLWNTVSFAEGPTLSAAGALSQGLFVAFSPLLEARSSAGSEASKRYLLAIAQPNGIIQVRDVERGLLVAELTDPHQRRLSGMCFSGDGSKLVGVSAHDSDSLVLWDLRGIRRLLAELGLDWDFPLLSAPTTTGTRALTLVASPEPSPEQLAEREIERTRKEHDANPNDPMACNGLAWALVVLPGPAARAEQARVLAERALRGATSEQDRLYCRNTLALADYRTGRHREAIALLLENLRTQLDREVAHDLYVLALAQHAAGERAAARASLAMAVRWRARQTGLPDSYRRELGALHGEATKLLGEPAAARGETR